MKTTKIARHLLFFLLVSSGFGTSLLAQNGKVKEFTLKEAQEYAVKNHYVVRNSKLDVDIAKKKIWETIAIGLPQANGSVKYQDYLDIPTTLMPDFISPAVYSVNEHNFGLTPTVPQGEAQYFPVQFGIQHNLSYGATLTQLIFNGQYIIGVQGSKAYLLYNEQNLEKSVIDVRQNVSLSYMGLAIQKENKRLLIKGKDLVSKTLYETKEQYKNGFVEDIVVDQLQLNLTNLESTINAVSRQIEVADKLLKFQIGLDISDSIILTDSIGSLLKTIQLEPVVKTNFKLEDHIDYRLTETNEKLSFLNKRLAQANYLPSIAGFYSYSRSAMSNTFSNLFSDSPYPTSMVGITIDVPIFSSGMKHFKVQQAQLALEKARNIKEAAGQALTLDAEVARTTFNTSLDNYFKENDNLKLAVNIYKKTDQKFKEGVSGSTDITTAYNQLLNTQTAYYQSIFNLLNAKIKLDKALNQY
ncbi:MAG: TolC family protein [Bacteroidota bacterium]